MNTNDDVSLLVESVSLFERTLAGVAADQWSLATQCVDWDVAELTIHSWDLARAAGGDERLPDSLVLSSLTYVEQLGSSPSSSTWFGRATFGGDSTDRQVQLLRASGRQP
jgi:Mycothiol maleylpyruvate isomerase N-terminal domain